MTAALVTLASAGAAIYVRQARIEQRRFEDARRLINAVVQEIQPKLESIPATLPLRQILIERTMTYLESVSRDAGNNVPLLLELGNAYAQLARVQGDVSTSTLGRQSAAGDRYHKAEALLQRAESIAPNDASVLKDAALFYGRLAGFENTQGQEEQAVAHARRAVECAERLQAARPGDFDAREILAFSVFYLATAAPAADWDLRVATYQRAGDLYRQLAGERPQKVNLGRNASVCDRALGSLQQSRGHLDIARTHAARALAASERQLAAAPNDPLARLDVAIDEGLLASIEDSAGDGAAARARHDRAIGLGEGIVTADPANARARLITADAKRHFVRNRLAAGDVAAARRAAQSSVEAYEGFRENGKLANAVNWRFAAATAALADVEAADGHAVLACDTYKRAVAVFEAIDRESALVDLVKVDADRARASLARCPASAESRATR